MSRGFIYNRHMTKQGMKDVYATSHKKDKIYKNTHSVHLHTDTGARTFQEIDADGEKVI